MKKVFFPCLAMTLLLLACNNSSEKKDDQRSTANGDQAAAVATIRAADSTWSVISEKKSAEGWLNYYSADAIMMPPGEKVCADPASREASVKNMFATPGIDLTFRDTRVEASASGDLGYATGVYQMTYKDSKGQDAKETGKYGEVWKKQADGNWKCVADIWNADPPAK